MTMMVDLGLERFFRGKPAEDRVAAVTALVAAGWTSCLREVIGDAEGAEPRVFEARRDAGRVVTRWLEGRERTRVLKDLARARRVHGTYADFSGDEADELGLEAQPLAFTLDGPKKPSSRKGVAIPGVEGDWPVMDAAEAGERFYFRRRHDSCKAASAMHRLAVAHRLIVHSG